MGWAAVTAFSVHIGFGIEHGHSPQAFSIIVFDRNGLMTMRVDHEHNGLATEFIRDFKHGTLEGDGSILTNCAAMAMIKDRL